MRGVGVVGQLRDVSAVALFFCVSHGFGLLWVLVRNRLRVCFENVGAVFECLGSQIMTYVCSRIWLEKRT